ncbi:hypothetical protein D3C86_1119350 [compost metagenome]
MDEADVQFQRHGRHVLGVEPLHDDHDGRRLHVVHPVGDAFAEDADGGLSLGVGLGALGRVRVVDLHPVAPAAGHRTERAGLAEPVVGVLELALGVLVGPKGQGPEGAVLIALDQATKLEVVAEDVGLAVGGGQGLKIGPSLRSPLPCCPEHQHQRLHHARRDGDQQELDLPVGDGLEMPAHGPQSPARLERPLGLQNRPMLLDEAVQAVAAGAYLALALGQAFAVGLSLPPGPFRPDLFQRRQRDE